MANNFSDNFNKTIATAYNKVGQLRALGDALGILEGPKARNSLAKRVYSEIEKNGVNRAALAYTEITSPKAMRGGNGRFGSVATNTFLSYRNDSFSTPGLAIATSDVRRYGIGPLEKKPYAATYQDVTFNYILDTAANQHKYFYLWMNHIVKHHKGIIFDDENPDTGAKAYEVGYKDDYATRIDIYSFDDRLDQQEGDATTNNAQQVILHRAYPTFIGDIQYNWAGIDQLVRLPVSFTYFTWEMKTLEDAKDLQKVPNDKMGIFDALLKAGSAIQALSTLRNPRNIADVVNVANVGRSFR